MSLANRTAFSHHDRVCGAAFGPYTGDISRQGSGARMGPQGERSVFSYMLKTLKPFLETPLCCTPGPSDGLSDGSYGRVNRRSRPGGVVGWAWRGAARGAG